MSHDMSNKRSSPQLSEVDKIEDISEEVITSDEHELVADERNGRTQSRCHDDADEGVQTNRNLPEGSRPESVGLRSHTTKIITEQTTHHHHHQIPQQAAPSVATAFKHAISRRHHPPSRLVTRAMSYDGNRSNASDISGHKNMKMLEQDRVIYCPQINSMQDLLSLPPLSPQELYGILKTQNLSVAPDGTLMRKHIYKVKRHLPGRCGTLNDACFRCCDTDGCCAGCNDETGRCNRGRITFRRESADTETVSIWSTKTAIKEDKMNRGCC